ncbi:MAG: cobyrinate a,c-diamide synthase, partial [Rhodospirillaceae bacterium]
MIDTRAPRIVVAGLAGDAGKTLVTLAILLAARERGLDVRGFKKGPDYIDASWIAWASGAPARNLDTFLPGPAEAARSFARHAARPRGHDAGAVNVIEGNRGVFDGVDAAGTHSTAALARLLEAPVVLVLNARKVTATAAAPVRGCQAIDPALRIAGVVLNEVSGARHAGVAREAIERACGVPVLGVIPRLEHPGLLPGRHLGLVPPAEHGSTARAAGALLAIAQAHLDLDRLLAAAASAAPMGQPDTTAAAESGIRGIAPGRVTIGYVSDSAFSFYYPENLEALESRGAALVPVSSLAGGPLPPELDALYIGGGFPETHGAAIAANTGFLGSLRDRSKGGLPIFGECGGLMLLARSMTWRGATHT